MNFKQLITSASMQLVRNVLAALLLFAATATASAQAVEADTLEVRFRLGQSDLELSYADNERRINEFVAKVKQHFANAPENSLKMDIYGGASPEGPNELNRRLGEQRGIALKEVLIERLRGIVDQITVINQGARWGGLYSMVEKSNEPWKYDVLEVLTKTPENDGWQVDPREQKLRKMKKGTIWNQLLAKYLPTLRSSGSAVVAPMTEFEKQIARDYCDTLVIRDTVIYLPEPCPVYEEPIDSSWVWAIKTNFLLWGLVAPNGQVEFPLGHRNRWSIEGEVFWPWFIWNHNANAHQCGNLGVELRYWLGDRKKHHTLDGWHIGLAAAAGYYDFEWKKHEGYQGEYLNIYGNFGYQHRWGKRKQWAIDAGLGFGWIPTKYREYLGSSIFPVGHEEEYDDHLMWQKTSSKHIFGLTHANITLAYMIHPKNKKKAEVIEEAPAPIVPVNYAVTSSQPTDKKAEKAAAKADKEAAKAAEKADKEAAKAAAKADKEAAKAAAKADKEAAKAAAKAEKEAAKAAKADAKARAKAEIEAEKAARKAAKAN